MTAREALKVLCALCHHPRSSSVQRTVYAGTDGWRDEYCRDCTADFSNHPFTAEDVPSGDGFMEVGAE